MLNASADLTAELLWWLNSHAVDALPSCQLLPSMSQDGPPHHIDTAELKDIYDFALSLGRRAGRILLDGVEERSGEQSGRWQGQEDKASSVDIVTQIDLGAYSLPSLSSEIYGEEKNMCLLNDRCAVQNSEETNRFMQTSRLS